MGEPIVSPWIFYWIDVLGTIKEMFEPTLLLSGSIAAIGALTWNMLNISRYPSEEEKEMNKRLAKFFPKFFKVIGIVVVTVFVVTRFIPSEETMYKMLAAQYITVDNLNTVGAVTKETIQGAFDHSVDRLIDVIKTAKE